MYRHSRNRPLVDLDIVPETHARRVVHSAQSQSMLQGYADIVNCEISRREEALLLPKTSQLQIGQESLSQVESLGQEDWSQTGQESLSWAGGFELAE